MTGVVQRRPWYRSRGWWLRQLHSWHWISAAVSLSAMLMFAATGLTLNHAATISATPVTTEASSLLPPALRARLTRPHAKDAPLPDAVASAVERAVGADVHGRAAEWSNNEAYVALPRPGGDGWVTIDRATGRIEAERTDRGWVSYLNDLHKGRNAGDAWFWFIDAFAVACLLFTLTGLAILQLHARHRPSTWPLVLAGLALPAAIAVVLIH